MPLLAEEEKYPDKPFIFNTLFKALSELSASRYLRQDGEIIVTKFAYYVALSNDDETQTSGLFEGEEISRFGEKQSIDFSKLHQGISRIPSDDEVIYFLVTESDEYASSIRLKKNRLGESVALRPSGTEMHEDGGDFELFNFARKSYTFGSSEYILFYLVLKTLIEIGVSHVIVRLSESNKRLFKMLGMNLEELESDRETEAGHQCFKIKTDKLAFQAFYRQVPARDTTILRMIDGKSGEGAVNPQMFIPNRIGTLPVEGN